MTTPPALVLATYIESNTDLALGTNLFVGALPDEPILAAALYDTLGVDDGKGMDGTLHVHRGVQIIVRSRAYAAGWAKIKEMEELFSTLANETVSINTDSFIIAAVMNTSGPFTLGLNEAKNATDFALNLTITIEEQ